jgi:hypothetical protein
MLYVVQHSERKSIFVSLGKYRENDGDGGSMKEKPFKQK